MELPPCVLQSKSRRLLQRLPQDQVERVEIGTVLRKSLFANLLTFMPLSSCENHPRVLPPSAVTKTSYAKSNKMVKPRHLNAENMLNSNEDWIEKAGSISQAFNKLLAKSACKLCNVYVDEQVEFENRQEDYKTSMAKAWGRSYKPSMEVELYRQMLFDEESVVDSVTGRDEATLNAFDQHFATTRRPGDDGTVTTQKSA